MRAIWIVPVIASILILGILGSSQDVFSAIFTDAFDVSGEETIPHGLAFNTDGTKMFVLGQVDNDVNEYACTTGFDVSTCAFTVKADNPFSVAAQEDDPFGLAFNTDGTKMFVVGFESKAVNEYACGTGFDVSTCAYSGDVERFDVSEQEGNPRGLAFNTDGTKMFVMGIIGRDVNEYACGTGFDVSTCGFTVRFLVSAQHTFTNDLAFNTDGTKMFVVGFTNDAVTEYACTTGFDVSTCAYSGDAERFDVSGQEGGPTGLAFNTDGTKMFVLGVVGDDVNEYFLPIAFDVSSVPPCKTCADFNGDGFDDLAVGVMFESLSGTDEGSVNVIYGSASGLHPNLGHTDQFFHQDSLKIEDTAEDFDRFAGVLAVGNFNNDLYDDLAIGVLRESLSGNSEGAVNVIYGSAKALHKGLGHADQFFHQDSLKIEDTAETGDNFGSALAVGDFNNDGFDDLAIGVPFEDVSGNDDGAVNIIYGSAKALHKGLGHADQFFHQDSLKIEDTAETADNFGRALAAGDFNGDGFDDLAIGVPGEDLTGTNNEGAVNVIYGSSKGVHKGFSGIGDQFWTQDTFKIEDTAEPFDFFGTALAAGDFNNDGFDDLAIGVPFEDLTGNQEGAVNVIYGSPKGLHKGLGLPDQLWHQDSPGIEDTAEDFDNFGGILAVGDFNDDGFADLAIGIPDENLSGTDEGSVNVIYGSAIGLHENLGLPDQFWTQDSTGIADTAEGLDRFGHALTVGDFNNDGFDDLAIGVPSEALTVDDQGAVNVIYGSASGLHRNLGLPDQFWSHH